MKNKKTGSFLTVEKGDDVFTFIIPHGTSWGNVIDASYEILQEVYGLYKAEINALKPVHPQGSLPDNAEKKEE